MKHILLLTTVSLALLLVPSAEVQASGVVDTHGAAIDAVQSTPSSDVADSVSDATKPAVATEPSVANRSGVSLTLNCGTIGLETHCTTRVTGGVSCGAFQWSYAGEQPNAWLPDGDHAELWLRSSCNPNRINTVSVTVSCANGTQSRWRNIPCDNGSGGGGAF